MAARRKMCFTGYVQGTLLCIAVLWVAVQMTLFGKASLNTPFLIILEPIYLNLPFQHLHKPIPIAGNTQPTFKEPFS